MILGLGLEVYCSITGSADDDSVPQRGLGDSPLAITKLLHRSATFHLSFLLLRPPLTPFSHLPSFSPPFQLVHPYQV